MASVGDIIAVDGADGGLVGKRSRHEETPGAAEGVHGAGVKRVVDAEHMQNEPGRADVDGAGGGADDDCRPRLHVF